MSVSWEENWVCKRAGRRSCPTHGLWEHVNLTIGMQCLLKKIITFRKREKTMKGLTDMRNILLNMLQDRPMKEKKVQK